MSNTNLELLSHVKDYQKNGQLSAEGWIFFTEFIERLGYSGVKGYAKKYPHLWQDMQDNAMEYIMKTSLNNCDTNDADEAWSYISKCIYGIFANTRRDYNSECGKWDDYKNIVEDDFYINDDNVMDDKDRRVMDFIDPDIDNNNMNRTANYLIKYAHKKMIITDDIKEMRAFIGKQSKVKADKKIKIKSVKGKVVITLPNKDIGYAGDMIFKADKHKNKFKEDKNYAMIVPEALLNCYNHIGD